MSWANPLPVSVVLVPVDGGLLLVRRAIPPVGQLALPGGYINLGESWEEAGARASRRDRPARRSRRAGPLPDVLDAQARHADHHLQRRAAAHRPAGVHAQ